MERTTCKERGCDRPVFTQKSGQCHRHYDRARTAVKAAIRPAVQLVREQKCVACGGMGYKRWGGAEGGVICKRHADMWARRGTLEDADRESAPKPECQVDGCTNLAPYTQYGIFCQNHHRMAKRRGNADFTVQLPKGPARYGSTDHRKKDSEQVAANLAARRAARIGEDCGRGHVLDGDNLRINADGSLTCRACERAAQDRYLESVKGEAATKRRKSQDAYNKWARELRHRYGLTPEKYNQKLSDQENKCDSCGEPLQIGTKNVCIDHDHSCCAGPQSCGKCVRGIICTDCNLGLGRTKDDPLRMAKLIVYVLKYRCAAEDEYLKVANIVLYE